MNQVLRSKKVSYLRNQNTILVSFAQVVVGVIDALLLKILRNY
jgi:hypothetical protein